jgi:Fe-S cluster biosynthesis and repair protein YggX
MDIAQRIAQFEAMVRPEADPTNDMAWFSLAGAYAQADRHAEAAKAYLRCTELNPSMSKAFQLAGQAYVNAGQKAAAAEVLLEGFKVAASRGDRMPLKAITDLLTSIGIEPPPPPAAPAGKTVSLVGGPASDAKLPRPPFKGPIGQWIFENVTAETWDGWVRQGTKVINEMRLDLSRDDHADTYDRYMREHLGIDDALYEQLTGQKPPATTM